MEAQRFPNDFDGLIAGAPANFLTHQMAGYVWNQQGLLSDTAAYIPYTKLPVIQAAAQATCDAADGITDGIINDPSTCTFNPSSLLCAGAESDTCLSRPQLASLERIYAGPWSAHTGAVFPGYEPGGEAFNLGNGSWSAWITGTTPGNANEIAIANQFFAYMVFDDPAWDFKTFDFDTSLNFTDDKLASILNATNPHLRGIEALGGKLIIYHGWNDPAIPPRNSIAYYEAVIASQQRLHGEHPRDGLSSTRKFARLFMVPGMNHCAGGSGPNSFDMLGPLETWVERGIAPDRIVAFHRTAGAVDRDRPLCPYPQVAVYSGEGSKDDETNFVCIGP
jgi:feruloyl esterase